MTNYCKDYNDLAKEVENIIGRRYYVLNGQLAEKPETFTLDYALELGWNLTDAIYAQLAARGAERYTVKGIYAEGNNIFAILQDVTTLEYIKVDVNITGEDTVELGSDMVAVSMSWTPKAPVDETKVDPIVEREVVATETLVSTSSTMQSGQSTYAEVVDNAGIEIPENEGIENQSDIVTEEITEEPVEEVVEEVVEEASEEVVEEVIEEPVEEPQEEISEETVEEVEEQVDAAVDEAPVADVGEYTAKIADLENMLAQKDAKISELENTLAAYRKKEVAAEEIAKNEMVASYRKLLSDNEMQPVLDKLSDLSLDDLEAKLSVVYSRKQRQAVSTSFQVDVSAIHEDNDSADLPAFFKQAQEIDRKNNGLRL